MQPKDIITTEDGSHSISNRALNTSYHSRHGAIQESQHIFIDAGLKTLLGRKVEISIFEMGFGSGLNALLTIKETEHLPVKIYYETIETDWVTSDMASSLNFTEILDSPHLQPLFVQLHQLPWNSPHQLSDNFYFYKRQVDMQDVILTTTFDLIYYDAFAPEVQPELWARDIFSKLYESLSPGGILLTYCSKVSVRNAMEDAGFFIEKVPGPWGKREIVRAIKR